MAIIFNQSKKFRDLSLFDIAKLTEDECWDWFRIFRWGDSERTQCPQCKNWDKHYFVRTRKQWSCKNCGHRFSVTSGSPFASRKLSLAKILMLVFFFTSASQGQSCNEMHAKIGVTLKTIFHNFGKIRECLFETMDTSPLNGVVHIDCAHFCGKPRRANKRKKTDSFVVNNRLRSRKDAIVPDLGTHPEPWNFEKLQKRRVLLAMTQFDASTDNPGANRTICVVLKRERSVDVIPLIRKFVSRKALIMTDSGRAFASIYADLGNRHFTVNHSAQYMTEDGVSNNMAETFFSRVRRAEFGTFNGMRPQYFAFYAAEFAWRADSRHLSLSEKFSEIFKKIFSRETSKAFCNYNHGHRLGFEYVH